MTVVSGVSADAIGALSPLLRFFDRTNKNVLPITTVKIVDIKIINATAEKAFEGRMLLIIYFANDSQTAFNAKFINVTH